MKSTNRYPKNLAQIVHSELKKRGKSLDLNCLISLFETLYFTSLRKEEGQPLTCYIIYISDKNPDPRPPLRIVRDRWSYLKFASRVSFTVTNLQKLAYASDPKTSSFAIYSDNKELYVWGIIDQANRYHEFLNYDSDAGPERPGVFQASIVGIGHIAVFIEYEKIAELKVGRIQRESVDILAKGPVYSALKPGIEKYIRNITKSKSIISEDLPYLSSGLTENWTSSLYRLLLRICSHKHGGAILITRNDSVKDLKVKYQIDYPRLKKALTTFAITNIHKERSTDKIINDYLDRRKTNIPTQLYLDSEISSFDVEESKSEIDGTLWFISLLSRVDGLILMNQDLEVKGFGVEITTKDIPTKVYLASDGKANKIHEIDYNLFGTRHRSMMRYCFKFKGSTGFVISQDGDVRAMTVVKDKLIIWDNLRLQRNFRVTRSRESLRSS
jgi:hypothetical protein